MHVWVQMSHKTIQSMPLVHMHTCYQILSSTLLRIRPQCFLNMWQASTELDAEVKKLSAERQRLAAEVQLKREVEQQYAKRCTLQVCCMLHLCVSVAVGVNKLWQRRQFSQCQ